FKLTVMRSLQMDESPLLYQLIKVKNNGQLLVHFLGRLVVDSSVYDVYINLHYDNRTAGTTSKDFDEKKYKVGSMWVKGVQDSGLPSHCNPDVKMIGTYLIRALAAAPLIARENCPFHDNIDEEIKEVQ